jgi:predicted GIY-YIG superfamily endonuclease
LGAQTGHHRRLHQDVQNHQLVYVEDYPDMLSAIAREKQLKGWSRAKKIALIEKANPGWEDKRLR